MSEQVLIPLGDLIDAWGPNDVGKLLNTFVCTRDPDLERFLRQDAIPFHEKHRSRTYLLLSEDGRKVLAYTTIGIKCLKVSEGMKLSNKIKKEMDVHKGVFQSYLIGQLGKADGAERGMGPKLIEFAISVFDQSFRSVGCRTVRLDCKQSLIKFYEGNGFKLISKEEDDDLFHMVMLF